MADQYVADVRRLVELLDLIEGMHRDRWMELGDAVAAAHGKDHRWVRSALGNIQQSIDYFRGVAADRAHNPQWRKRAAEYLLMLDIDSSELAVFIGTRVTPWDSPRTGRRWLDEVASICWRIYVPIEASERRASVADDTGAEERRTWS